MCTKRGEEGGHENDGILAEHSHTKTLEVPGAELTANLLHLTWMPCRLTLTTVLIWNGGSGLTLNPSQG